MNHWYEWFFNTFAIPGIPFLLLKRKINNNNINIIYIKGRRKGVAGVAILINLLGE